MEVNSGRITTLVIVCCHAIFLGSSNEGCRVGEDEVNEWLIEPFQTGETPTFIKHARAGVLELKSRLDRGEDAVLVFSGGATKAHRGCLLTEGQSYLNLCTARNFFGEDTDPPTLAGRTFAEQYATDSYQNILLSLVQYPTFRRSVKVSIKPVEDSPTALHDSWPQNLVIVSHDFKRSRFMDLHIPAINAPLVAVEYIGIDPPLNSEQLAQVVEGDRVRGYGAWKNDVRGTGALLHQKRLSRGWDEQDFIRDCITTNDALSPGAKHQLVTLIRGDAAARWPKGCAEDWNSLL